MFNTILNLAAAAKNTGSTKGVGHRCDKDEQTLIASFNSALRLAVTKTDYPRLSAPAGPSNFTQKILAKTRQIRYHFFFALLLPHKSTLQLNRGIIQLSFCNQSQQKRQG